MKQLVRLEWNIERCKVDVSYKLDTCARASLNGSNPQTSLSKQNVAWFKPQTVCNQAANFSQKRIGRIMNYHLEQLLNDGWKMFPGNAIPPYFWGHSENADVGFTQIQHAWQTGYRPDRHQCLHTIGGILQPQGGIGDVEIGGVGRKIIHQQNKFSLFWFTNIFSSLQMPGAPSGNETTCIFHFPDVEDTSKILHGVASALGLLTPF